MDNGHHLHRPMEFEMIESTNFTKCHGRKIYIMTLNMDIMNINNRLKIDQNMIWVFQEGDWVLETPDKSMDSCSSLLNQMVKELKYRQLIT